MVQEDTFRDDGHVDGVGDGEWFYGCIFTELYA